MYARKGQGSARLTGAVKKNGETTAQVANGLSHEILQACVYQYWGVHRHICIPPLFPSLTVCLLTNSHTVTIYTLSLCRRLYCTRLWHKLTQSASLLVWAITFPPAHLTLNMLCCFDPLRLVTLDEVGNILVEEMDVE